MKSIQKASILVTLLVLCVSLFASEYRIVDKDCLWNLAGRFYSDSYQWERIWRANPYITNPHLIYPGDVLVIPGHGNYEVQQDGTVEKVEVSFDDKVSGLFATTLNDSVPVEVDVTNMARFEQEKSYLYSSSMMKRCPFAWNMATGKIEPGVAAISKNKKRKYMQQFDTVAITQDQGQSVALQDTFVIVKSVDILKDKSGTPFNIMKPIGAATVQKTGPTTKIFINEAWDIISSEDRLVSPLDYTASGAGKVTFKKESEVSGKLLSRIENKISIHPNEMMILDFGANAGVAKGDLFTVHTVDSKGIPDEDVSYIAMAIRADDKTTTVIINKVYTTTMSKDLFFKRYGSLRVDAI